MIREVKHSRYLMGKLEHDSDLLEWLNKFCKAKNVTLGRVEVIGSVKRARLAYYAQKEKIYRYFEVDEPLEITSLIGNVSLREGEPVVHAHVNLANAKGEAFGGHLAQGTVVFAGEFLIQEFTGPEFSRGFDEATGLPLWSNEDTT